MNGQITLVLGAQWGDEGKGKLVDHLSPQFDYVARATGGANAGHTVYADVNGEVKKFVFHLLPSGILHEGLICVIGNGVVLHVPTLFAEIDKLKASGFDVMPRLKLSNRVALLFEYHKLIDGAQEAAKGGGKIGTTLRGIGPAYTDKISRRGLRLCDLEYWEDFEAQYRANLEWHQKVYGFDYDPTEELDLFKRERGTLLGMSIDATYELNHALESGKRILMEGANAALLDIDHGTYPYVTSSSPTIGGAFTGTGMNARHLGDVIGIVKAYLTRVGGGPFPTELLDDLGEKIRTTGGEFGSTTGRPRRCGWFDLPLMRYSLLLNGYTALNLTKLDVLDDLDEIKIATEYRVDGKTIQHFPATLKELEKVEVVYETMPGWKQPINQVKHWVDLPSAAQNYVLRLEELLKCPIRYVGVGPERDQLLIRE